MSRTQRHPSNNVVPMFRRQPTTAQAAERLDITRELFLLTGELLALADRADPAELKYVAFRLRQTANDVDYKAEQLDLAVRLSPADAYTPAESSDDPSADEWVIDIAAPSALRDAA